MNRVAPSHGDSIIEAEEIRERRHGANEQNRVCHPFSGVMEIEAKCVFILCVG